MSRSQRSSNNRGRRGSAQRSSGVDVWRRPAPLPEITKISVPADPTALVRSLGDPPMFDASTAIESFSMVVQRAAAIAAALALSADLLADESD